MTGRIIFFGTNTVKQADIFSRLKASHCPSLLLCLMLLFSFTVAFADEYIVYLPNQVDTAVSPTPGDGLLVKKITIKKGDTLSALSRKFSGKAGYFPQILLFNKIRNPNLIYAGQKLLVPLSATHPQGTLRLTTSVSPVKSHDRADMLHPERVLPTNSDKNSAISAEQDLYERSTALFAAGKYREALEGFSRFLKDFPSSPLAPDASLSRGDCYLLLSEI